MRHYTHLTARERDRIAELHAMHESGGRCVVSFSAIYRAVADGRPDPPDAAPDQEARRHLRRKGERPTVENANGLVREFFPKGTDFSKVTDEEVQHVSDMINDRPRKVLGYRTANEVYREMLHLD